MIAAASHPRPHSGPRTTAGAINLRSVESRSRSGQHFICDLIWGQSSLSTLNSNAETLKLRGKKTRLRLQPRFWRWRWLPWDRWWQIRTGGGWIKK